MRRPGYLGFITQVTRIISSMDGEGIESYDDAAATEDPTVVCSHTSTLLPMRDSLEGSVWLLRA